MTAPESAIQTEAELEANSVAMLEKFGFLPVPKGRTTCPHCHKPIGDKRWVDRTLCSPKGVFTAIEFKDPVTGLNTAEKVKRFEEQKVVLGTVNARSGHSGVVMCHEDLMDALRRWGYVA